jgi:hypothetical protein
MAPLISLPRGLAAVAAAEGSVKAVERVEAAVSVAEFGERRPVRAASEFLIGEFPAGAGLLLSAPR